VNLIDIRVHLLWFFVHCMQNFRQFLVFLIQAYNSETSLQVSEYIQHGPKKVSHFHKSSLNRIKIRH